MQMQQQKLLRRNTYTPLNASQVQCNCDLALNKEETLSVSNLKTLNNNPEVNLPQNTAGLKDIYVFIKSIDGKALMPCKPAKAKHLLKEGNAKVIKRAPFTIQLTFECKNKIQDITLGIDSGYQNIGFSAVSNLKELISGTVKLDNKTKERLDTKRMYRRNKRNKLWYRQSRFLNRFIPEGWLPPSIERRYKTHLNLIERLKNILPINKVIIEVGKFDIQKLENPDIKGVSYQQGEMYQYRNRIGYLLSREHGVCQYCKKQGGGNWRLHHILGKEKDRPKDWALLHEKCHQLLHIKKQENILRKQKSKSYKDSTFMNIIRKKFKQDIKCELTYGYYTFQNRCNLNLDKSHVNDAFVIATGNNQKRCKELNIIQKRRNNRILQKNRKGFKPSIRRQHYSIQPKDLVMYSGKKYFAVGIQNNGKYLKITDGIKFMVKAVKHIDVIFHQGSMVFA